MRSKLPPVIRDFSSLESLFMYLLTIRAGSSIGVFGPLLPIRTRSAPTSSTMPWIKAGLSTPAVSATVLGARFSEGTV